MGPKAGDDPRARKVLAEMTAVGAELNPLDPHATARGSVWLYLRRAAK